MPNWSNTMSRTLSRRLSQFRALLAGVRDAKLPAAAIGSAEALGRGFGCVATRVVFGAVADACVDELALRVRLARVAAEPVEAFLGAQALGAVGTVRLGPRVRHACAVVAVLTGR